MQKFIKSVPLAMSSLALAFAALGNLLLPYSQAVRYICGVISLLLLVLLVLKIILDLPHALAELKTPVPLSASPTATMTTMLLSAYIRPYVPTVAIAIWYTAIVLHVLIMLLFIKRFVVGFKLSNVFPTWFIAGVGIGVVSITAPAMGAITLGQIAFYIGLGFYILILPLVLARLSLVRILPEPATKTLAIFAAPMSLLVVGYFNSFINQGYGNAMFVYILLSIAVVSHWCVILMMFWLLKVKFYPTYAALAFPFVISASTFRIGANFIANRYGIYFWGGVAHAAMWLAIAVVAFVTVHYIRYFKFWCKF